MYLIQLLAVVRDITFRFVYSFEVTMRIKLPKVLLSYEDNTGDIYKNVCLRGQDPEPNIIRHYRFLVNI